MMPCACANTTVSQMREKTRSLSWRRALEPGVRVQPLSFNHLHGIEDAAVWQPAEIVNRDNARVLEPSQNSRLLGHAGGRLPVLIENREDFQRHAAVELLVPAHVDCAHAAVANLANQFVTGGAEIRQSYGLAQVVDNGIGQPAHFRP